jgi:hypothetical protein
MESAETPPTGAIFDTNSKGRFDLVVYDDGLLAVKGTYTGVALRGASAGMVGTGGGGLAGSVAAGGRGWEAQRLARVLATGRPELAGKKPNFFIPRHAIVSLMLRKRWYRHSLIVRTHENTAGRRFDWKPRLNNFGEVQEILTSTFPGLLNAR